MAKAKIQLDDETIYPTREPSKKQIESLWSKFPPISFMIGTSFSEYQWKEKLREEALLIDSFETEQLLNGSIDTFSKIFSKEYKKLKSIHFYDFPWDKLSTSYLIKLIKNVSPQ
jgi:hypothetical protein